MKQAIVILITLLSFTLSKAQEFKATTKYVLAANAEDKEQQYPPYLIHLTAADEAANELATIAVDSKDFMGEPNITSLDNPGLEGVSEIIKVSIPYEAACQKVVSYYFVVENNNNVVALSAIENLDCDNIPLGFGYIFPNQKYGKVGVIQSAQMMFTRKNQIKAIDVIRSIAWNDDDFEAEDIPEETGK